jgi:hypothetical protein
MVTTIYYMVVVMKFLSPMRAMALVACIVYKPRGWGLALDPFFPQNETLYKFKYNLKHVMVRTKCMGIGSGGLYKDLGGHGFDPHRLP